MSPFPLFADVGKLEKKVEKFFQDVFSFSGSSSKTTRKFNTQEGLFLLTFTENLSGGYSVLDCLPGESNLPLAAEIQS